MEVEHAAASLRSLATRPLTDQVRQELTRSIANGAFPEGRLPSESELAERLSVSRTTLRAALRSLEDEGMLTRQRGRGTRINRHVTRGLSLTRIVGFYELIREAGFDASVTGTSVATEIASAATARRLGHADECQVVRIDRLFRADGRPAVHVSELIGAEHVHGLVRSDAVPESIFQFVERYCDRTVDHTVVEIVPMVAGSEPDPALDLAGGTPYLRLVETHYSDAGEPFIVSDIAIVDDFVRFQVVRRRFSIGSDGDRVNRS